MKQQDQVLSPPQQPLVRPTHAHQIPLTLLRQGLTLGSKCSTYLRTVSSAPFSERSSAVPPRSTPSAVDSFWASQDRSASVDGKAAAE
jgi:hypothetical protein